MQLAPGTYNTVIKAADKCGGTAVAAAQVVVSDNAGVTVYTPMSPTAISPVKFAASASSPGCAQGISAMRIYTAPFTEAYTVDSDHLNTYLALPPGSYPFVVQAWDNCGAVFKTEVDTAVANAKDRHLYEVTNDFHAVNEFNIDPSGNLAFSNQASTQNLSPLNAVVDPTGRFLYVGGATNGIVGYRIDRTTGNLTLLPGSPFKVSTGRENFIAIGMDPHGNFVFASDAFNHMFTLQIDWATGKLSKVAMATLPALASGGPIVTDPSGHFVYAGVQVPNGIAAYKVDWATGKLAPVSGSPFPASGNSLNMSTTNRYLYLQQGDHMISGYRIDTDSGALTEVPGSPFNVNDNDMGVDPVYDRVYTGSAVISAWASDPGTGTLTLINQSTEENYETIGTLWADHSGQFLYGIVETSCPFPPCESSVASFRVDPQSGVVTKDSDALVITSFGEIGSLQTTR